MNKIYYISHFSPNINGHGGAKRTYQIKSLFEEMEFKLIELTIHPKRISKYKKLEGLLSNYKFIKDLALKNENFSQYKEISKNILKSISIAQQLPPNSVIIYEHSIISDWLLPIFLKKQGHKLIILPHNLETLVPNQISKFSLRSNPNGFFDEIHLLQHSDLVLAISKEEDWLLNLFEINSTYYPYYPIHNLSIDLDRISKLRKDRLSNNNFLIFGSTGNPPTKKGMLDLINYLYNSETHEMVFHVAGFDTDNLNLEPKFSEKFIIHGPVTYEDLNKLYLQIDAVIILQQPTTGALTKIPELLKAGIPVISNQYGARNFFNMEGVYVFREMSELISIIENFKVENNFNYEPDFNYNIVKQKINEVISKS